MTMDPRYKNYIMDFIYSAFKGRCWWCGVETKRTKIVCENQATLDHWVCKSAGGSSKISNLVLACQFCNNLRGNTSVAVFKQYFMIYHNRHVGPDIVARTLSLRASNAQKIFNRQATINAQQT